MAAHSTVTVCSRCVLWKLSSNLATRFSVFPIDLIGHHMKCERQYSMRRFCSESTSDNECKLSCVSSVRWVSTVRARTLLDDSRAFWGQSVDHEISTDAYCMCSMKFRHSVRVFCIESIGSCNWSNRYRWVVRWCCVDEWKLVRLIRAIEVLHYSISVDRLHVHSTSCFDSE